MYPITTTYGNPLTPLSAKISISNHKQEMMDQLRQQQKQPQFTPFVQIDYPIEIYTHEILTQNQTLEEYHQEISDFLLELNEVSKPNMELYKQQPYLTFSIRLKLIDFLLKMSIRLKILPFVFFRAVKLFDRYCSKRIVLLDQSQLIIVTCLWIASKIQGGNNHFVNLSNNTTNIKTINDIGYGSGGKFLGPTERFRLPKLHELVKLCGNKCKYDASMFKQMELHVLNTLEWSLNEPYVEDYIVQSFEFNVFRNVENEFFKVKEYLSYLSLYSHDLIDITSNELSQVIIDLINEIFKLSPHDKYYQIINEEHELIKLDLMKYKFIKKNLIKSILNSSDYMLKLFNSKGPQYLFNQIHIMYKIPNKIPTPPGSIGSVSPTNINSPTTPCSYKRNRVESNSSIVEAPPSKVNNVNTINNNNRSDSPIRSYTTNTITATIMANTNTATPDNRPSPYSKIQHHIPFPSYSFNSPISQPPNAPLPIIANKIRQTSNGSSNNRGYRLPAINTNGHHHNNSSVSINSSASCGTREDISMLDIFELDYYRKHNGTPASDNDSPLFQTMKPTPIT
ncbi:hypothetical protein DFJ63DRAFT_313975 [Scheffersomyces coipomensis]|uniref:uncharacterized protein n=1 Tax=Scheffersomyces coipomensis TaxID=1788519 RepID=UPI00315C9EC1